MPFLTPFAPAIIKGGIGLGASLLGSKLAGGTSKADQSLIDQQTQNATQGRALSTQLQGQGSNFLNLAQGSFNPVVDYWSQILSGNRGAATSMLGPQLNQIGDQYQAATASASALMPRGGGRSSLLQQLPYQQMRDQQALFQSARPQAAAGLLQTGNALSSTGSGLISNSINALYGSTAAGRSILDYNAQRRESDRATGAGIGKSIYELLKGINIGGGGGGSKAPGNIFDTSIGTGNA